MSLIKKSMLKLLYILSIILLYPTNIATAPAAQYNDDVFFPPVPVDYYNEVPICPPILCPIITCANGFTLVEDPTGCTCSRCECFPRFCEYIDCGKNDTMMPPCDCPYCMIPSKTTLNNLNTTGSSINTESVEIVSNAGNTENEKETVVTEMSTSTAFFNASSYIENNTNSENIEVETGIKTSHLTTSSSTSTSIDTKNTDTSTSFNNSKKPRK